MTDKRETKPLYKALKDRPRDLLAEIDAQSEGRTLQPQPKAVEKNGVKRKLGEEATRKY